MKNFLSKKLTLSHTAWLSLMSICTLGICVAQNKVNTDQYEMSEFKTKNKGQYWGFGITLSTGHGHFTGDIKKTYKGYIPIGMSFDVYYRNIDLYMGISFGYGKTRNDIPYDTAVWKRNDWYELINPLIGLGYVIADEPQFKMTPFAAVSYLRFGAATEFIFFEDDEDSPWDDVKFNKAYLLTLGINFDIKGSAKNNEVTACRLNYSYSFPVGNLNREGIDGGMHTFTIGINGASVRRWR